MKSLIPLVLALVGATSALAHDNDFEYQKARCDGALTRLRIHVVDDLENGVSNAVVRVFMGMNFEPKGKWHEGVSDSDGFFDVEGVTCGDEIVIAVEKAGWYPSRKKLSYAAMGASREVKDGRWQPFGNLEEIRLRQIKHPTTHSVSGKFVYTRQLNQWVGYDLEVNDFVSPEGTGKIADFELRINWTGRWNQNCHGMGVDIRFVGAHTGYCAVQVCQASAFKGPYCANVNGTFAQIATLYEGNDGEQVAYGKPWRPDSCWVVRSRCEMSPQKDLLKANYSIIYNVEFVGKRDGRGGIRIYRLFNPIPNDVNLEPLSYEAKKWLKVKNAKDVK